MNGGMVDLEIAEENAGTQDAEDAEAGADAIDGGVGDFARSFSAVEDDPVCFSLKAQEMPFKGGDFSTAPGTLLEQMDHALADEGFKGVRGSPEKEADEGSCYDKRDEARRKHHVAQVATPAARRRGCIGRRGRVREL
jgi:hypothetical protein